MCDRYSIHHILLLFYVKLKAHLLKVLDRLEEVDLKLSTDKCEICQAEGKYVGHVSEAGVNSHWK